MNGPTQGAGASEPVALPGDLVITALRAMDAEARERGRMYPQTADEQEADTKAVRRVIASLEFYTRGGQVGRNGWPSVKDWPALPATPPAAAAKAALDAEYCRGRTDGWEAAESRYRPSPASRETAPVQAGGRNDYASIQRAVAALNAAAFAHPSAADDIGTQCSNSARELEALAASRPTVQAGGLKTLTTDEAHEQAPKSFSYVEAGCWMMGYNEAIARLAASHTEQAAGEPVLFGIRNTSTQVVIANGFRTMEGASDAALRRSDNYAHFEAVPLYTATPPQAADGALRPVVGEQKIECGICHGNPDECDIHDCGDAHRPQAMGVEAAEWMAREFHRLAPSFGYHPRPETRTFDPTSPNGGLMIAVCQNLLAATQPKSSEPPSQTIGEALLELCDMAEAVGNGNVGTTLLRKLVEEKAT